MNSRNARQTCIGGAGNCCLDYLFVAPETERGGSAPVTGFSIQGGGLTATALVACARLGAATRFVSVLGEDETAACIEAELERYGVRERRILRVSGVTTPVSFIHVDADTGQRTIFHHCPDALKSQATEDYSFLAGCDVVLVDDVYPALGLGAARFARERGIPVIADTTPGEENRAFLSTVDVLIAPGSGMGNIPDDRAVEHLLRGYRRLGPETVVLTLGHRGWAALGPEGICRGEAFEVPVVDTTGAGDVFHGAFGFGWARGWNLEQCARFASATAALKCTRLGGRAGIPSLNEVDVFLNEHDRRSIGNE